MLDATLLPVDALSPCYLIFTIFKLDAHAALPNIGFLFSPMTFSSLGVKGCDS